MRIGRPWGRGCPSIWGAESWRPVRPPRPLFLVAADHLGCVGEAIVAIFVAKVLLAELAGRGVRQIVDELDRVGKPPFGDFLRQEIPNLALGDLPVIVSDD